MTVRRKKYPLLMLGLLVLLLGLAWFRGPLFPWSPWKPGYETIASQKAVIYVRDRSRLGPGFFEIDEIMENAERMFNLKYQGPVKVIVTLSYPESRGFWPWKFGGVPAGQSLEVGDVVYLRLEVIEKRKMNAIEYLEHELCHSLVHQNAGLLNAFRMNRQHWVIEGAAEYFGGPYYYNREEFVELFKNHKLIVNETSRDLYANLEPLDPKFNYTLYRFFTDYLVTTYSLPAYQAFLHAYLQDPRRARPLFAESFHVPLAAALENFASAMRAEAGSPSPRKEEGD